jgi:hypothetical protein
LAEPNGAQEQYLIKPEAVRRAIDLLANRRSHNHLPGYLALLRQRQSAGLDGMRLSDIEGFHADFMRVAGAPKKKPYIQPFLSRGKGAKLLNRNLQGSYAPKSIRPEQPLARVVKLVDHSSTGEKGGGVEYLLVQDHADKVLSEMLAGNRILGASLAAFLFRDRQLTLKNGSPDGLIAALREFFRIREEDKDGDYIFGTLFEDDTQNFSESDFEKV